MNDQEKHEWLKERQTGIGGATLCQCGCGKSAPIASKTNSRLRHVKGQPVRFIQGHQFHKGANGGHGKNWKGGRKKHGRYLQVWNPKHPHANTSGYVYEHVLVASKALRHPLPNNAVVHHINGDPADNRKQNLIICDSVSYHRVLHVREQAWEASGHPDWKKCAYCKGWSSPRDLYIPPNGGAVRHRSCFADYMREYQRKRRQVQ